MKPRGGYVLLYMYMYRYNHDYVMDFYFTVMLRSTTGPYGRPVIEVAYGEILLSLHRGCVRDDSSERVVGVSTWCRPCWTYPGQHQCELNVYYFLGFHTIKTYILFSKAICSIKKNTGGFWPCPDPTRFREYFRPPMSFKRKA